MNNKRRNRWLDMQIVVATLSITASVTMWNLFANDNRFKPADQADDPQTYPAAPDELEPFSPLLLGGPTPANMAAAPTRTLFFAQAPTTTAIPYVYIAPAPAIEPAAVVAAAPEPALTEVAAPEPAPQPVTVTKSSRP